MYFIIIHGGKQTPWKGQNNGPRTSILQLEGEEPTLLLHLLEPSNVLQGKSAQTEVAEKVLAQTLQVQVQVHVLHAEGAHRRKHILLLLQSARSGGGSERLLLLGGHQIDSLADLAVAALDAGRAQKILHGTLEGAPTEHLVVLHVRLRRLGRRTAEVGRQTATAAAQLAARAVLHASAHPVVRAQVRVLALHAKAAAERSRHARGARSARRREAIRLRLSVRRRLGNGVSGGSGVNRGR
eukprot:jgi/Mesvir1/25754/Mv26026-RA.1